MPNKNKTIICIFTKFIILSGLYASFIIIILIFSYAFANIIRPSGKLKPHIQLKSQNYFYFFGTNEQKHKINACYVKASEAKSVVILCHGHGGSHLDLIELAEDLRKFGINSLILDFRAHGNSTGTFTTLGLYEWNDIVCILNQAIKLNYISTDTFIAAYGRSMGASTLINGAKYLKQIKIFILESPFSNLMTIAVRDFSRITKIQSYLLIKIGIYIISFVTSIPYYQNIPFENAQYFENRPVMLIHDALDERATLEDHLLLKSQTPNVTEWIVENAHHVQAYNVNPNQFLHKFTKFLLNNNFPINNNHNKQN